MYSQSSLLVLGLGSLGVICWFGPLGRYVGANVSCHAWWSLVWSRLGYNEMYNVVWGMYNAVSVVKFTVYN